MTIAKFFSMRSLLAYFAIIAVIWVSPEQLFSQTDPQTQQKASAGGAEGTTNRPRVTTSIQATPEAAPTTTKKGTGPEKSATVNNPAEQFMSESFDTIKKPSLITQAAVLTLFSLLPFIIMILTSFLKIVVVLSLLRSALGVQQAPPNQIINGVAFMLSIFVMYPTILKMYDASQQSINRLQAPESLISEGSSTYILAIANDTKEPLREFLKRNSSPKHQELFFKMAYRVLPEDHRPNLHPDDFMILVPAYITSQLKEAFEIGVLIYIPFFVIDLVTSNILLAMGMMMLSPVTISMPLKLFLLVMLDGWTLLIEGLVGTFH